MARSKVRAAVFGWSFEDVRPGLTIEHPGSRTIGSDEHIWLAMISNNASDLHGNADYARRTDFGQPVVLGALTVAVVLGLAQPVEWPPADAALGRSGGWISIRLAGPVFAGDTLRAESAILSVAPLADGRGGLVRRRIVGRNQHGEEVVTIDEERRIARRTERNKGLLTTNGPV